MPWFSGKRSSVWSSSQLLYKFCGRAATSRKHKSRAGTDRLRGLQWSWGEGVPTAAALGTEVRRRRRRVVYVRQDIVVSPLLLCAVGIVTVCWGGPSEMTIWNRRERKKRLIWFRFFHLPSYFSFYSLTNPGFLKPITTFIDDIVYTNSQKDALSGIAACWPQHLAHDGLFRSNQQILAQVFRTALFFLERIN